MIKRRSRGEGSIRKRPNGTWEARLTLPNGKQKSFYGKTQRDAKAKLKDAQDKIEAGIDPRGERLTVAFYLTEWIDDVKTHLSPSTHISYTSYLRTHLIPHLGTLKLTDLKAPHVNKMLKEMSANGCSARTQNLARAILRKALNDAMDADLIVSNAAAKARPAKQDVKQISPLSPNQVQTLLRYTRDHWYGPLIHTAIGTGMRQGELLGLRWQDVDLDDSVIKIENAMQRVDGVPTFVKPKTDKSRRTIALDPSTSDALRRQLAQVALARQAAGDRWQEWNLVFPSRIGTPLNASNVTHQFQALLAEVGLPRQKFHDLRHCAASLLLSEGADMKIIQDFLGHAQISLTANTYTHLTDKVRRDTANRMGAALSGTNSAKG